MNKDNCECCNLDSLISDFNNHLKKYLLGKIHNNELSEDIVQEVMLKVVAAHQMNVQVKNIRAWIYQITRNTLIDYYRKKQNHEHVNQEQLEEVLIELQDKSFRPEEYLVPMIHLLPQKYSSPLLLSDIDSIPQNEIAKQLNLSVSATKMRIQRARKMLYAKFVECCDIEFTKSGAFSNCTIKESCFPVINTLKSNDFVSFSYGASSSFTNSNSLN